MYKNDTHSSFKNIYTFLINNLQSSFQKGIKFQGVKCKANFLIVTLFFQTFYWVLLEKTKQNKTKQNAYKYS